VLGGAAILLQVLVPVAPYHQATADALQQEWAALPPYPGSTVVQSNLNARYLDVYSSLEVDYASSGVCSDVQVHYANAALASGWRQQHALARLHHGSNPQQDELDASYVKTVHGMESSLSVACSVEQSFQSGYVLIFNIPPAH
jgi:hypothetical protein